MAAAVSKAKRKMFISVLPEEQVEVIIAHDGRIQEYYVEMLHQSKTKGNIYKGKIHNIDQALQAAFITYGAEKNGFLQVDEVHPEYYLSSPKSRKGSKYPPLQEVLRPGQEVLVQVVKDPTGTKGAFLTTYLSLPGRYFVLTPGREQLGISRKIESEDERSRLKQTVEELNLDEGLGVIVRTVSEGQSKTSLSRDLQFLKRLWKDVRKKGVQSKTPSLIHEEKDLAFRAVRDYLTQDIIECWVDHDETARQVKEFVSLVYPRRKKLVKVHTESEKTLFERFNLEVQLEQIFSREVSLPSGGQLVFDQAEALMAVDINSGRIGGEKNFREMAFRTNLEAAEEIPNQLRLRDIGGQVVIDFIEMKDHKHVREVEKTLRAALKSDKARTDMGRISKFGLLELVRQRLGTSALSLTTELCPCCNGAGTQRNLEWRSLQAIRELYRELRRKNCPDPLEFRADPELAYYLLNRKRGKIAQFQEEFNVEVHILPSVAQ
ncbi:MAG TPA: Rne/Rng family ribonuclease [Desulfomicrobiaceae bacterium]|nr:Rne/Rng family ribonuclease [Desulfomicrobiaceae bacterium]